MRKTTLLAAGVLLGATLLTGCGGDGDSSSSSGYCDTLKKAAAEIKDFTANDSSPDFSKFDDFVDQAEKLADKAPAEVKDDWKYVVDAMGDLTDALDEAGVKIEDLMSAVTSGQMPEGLDPEKLTELGTKLQGLTSEKLTEATDAIDKHAKDECKVDLSES